MNKALSAIQEASISVACLLEDVAVNDSSDLNLTELQKDIEHLQDQITIIENYLEPFVKRTKNEAKQSATKIPTHKVAAR